MDQYYYEEGYIEAGYHVYIAEARVDLGPYIEDAYIDPQYYEYYGITVSFAAELTEIVGEVVEAFGTWSSSFTQTATISHIEGADLFAFSEAAISVTVERIRDNNVAVSGVFSTAIDAVRYRDISGDEAAEFAIDANVERSRDFDIETQAAFSFDSTGSRIRFADADTNVAASLTATISHIEGADIVVENFATLTATANYTVDNASAISTQASVAADITYTIGELSAAVSSRFTIFARAESRYDDWVYISGGTINTSIKKFGTGSLSGKALYYASNEDLIQDRFTIDAWVYITQDVNNGNFFVYKHESITTNYISLGYLPRLTDLGFPTGRQYFFHSIRTSLGGTVGNDTLRTESSYNINTWYHVALVMNTNNNQVQVYVNGTRQRIQINQTGSFVDTATLGSVQFEFDQPKRAEVGHATDTYVDELRVSGGGTEIFLGTLPTSYTVPTQPYNSSSIGKKFLVHYDTNFRNDLTELESAVANLSSQSNLTAGISIFYQNNPADLSSEFALSAQASVDRGADLTAFATGSLELDAERVRFGDSAASAEVTVSAESVKITEVTADLVAECAVSADVSRTRDNEIATDSIATQIAVVAKTGNTLVDVNVVSTVTASATLTADRTSSITSNADFAVINQRIRDAVSDQTAQSTLSADALRVKQIAADVSSEAQVTAVAVKTVDADTSITTSFDLDVDTSGIKQGIALVFSLGTLTINETLFKNFDADLAVIASQTTDTTDSLNKGGEAQLSSSTSLSADFVRTRDVYIGYAGDRTAKTVSTFGNVAVSTAQAKFGSGSALITDTGDYFTVSGDSTLYNGNFTVEMWAWATNLTQMPNGTIWDNRTSTSNGFYLYVSYGSIGLYEGINFKGLTSAGFNNSQWNHIAVVRNGTNIKVFVNGVQKISATVTTTNYSNRTTYIGSTYAGAVPFRAYIDEVRLSASARYLSGFTPATSAYVNDSETSALLHLDTAFSDDNAVVPGPEIESTVSATNDRIRQANIDIDGVFSDSTLAAKAATGLVEITVTTTQSTTAEKTTDIDSELLVIASFQADGTTNIVGESAVTATVTMSVSAVKTASAVSTSQAQASVTAEVSRIRPFAVLVFSLGTLTATAERSRDTTADIAAENTVTANVGKIIQFECNFGSLFSPSVSIRKIFINIYVYRIPREDRTYRIKAETRRHVIPEETRIYNIRR